MKKWKINLSPISLILILILSLASCSKSSQSPSDKNSERGQMENSLDDDINNQRYDEALEKIHLLEERDQGTPRTTFLHASILIARSNIHIYSLFPLLDLHLFYAPSIDWNENKKRRNPYTTFIDRYVQDEALEQKLDSVSNENKDLITKKRKEEIIKTMNFIWGIYESIPHLELIPYLNQGDRVMAKEGIELLQTLFHTPEYGRSSYLYRSLVASIILANLIKESVPTVADGPISFFCNINLAKLTDNYEDMSKMLYYIVEGLQKTNQDKKVAKYQEVLDNLRSSQYLLLDREHYGKIKTYQISFCQGIPQ